MYAFELGVGRTGAPFVLDWTEASLLPSIGRYNTACERRRSLPDFPLATVICPFSSMMRWFGIDHHAS